MQATGAGEINEAVPRVHLACQAKVNELSGTTKGECRYDNHNLDKSVKCITRRTEKELAELLQEQDYIWHQPKKLSRTGFVYIIRQYSLKRSNYIYKYGCTNCMQKRTREYSRQNGEFEVIRSWEVPHQYHCEQIMKQAILCLPNIKLLKYNDPSAGSEWFEGVTDEINLLSSIEQAISNNLLTNTNNNHSTTTEQLMHLD
jgi:hypothetical protein